MPPSRPARIGDQIREELSQILARQVKDPRIGFVTITRVQVTPDLQLARVYFTVLGDADVRRDTGRGLTHALPFVRREIGQRLRLRRVPDLRFIYDDSVEREERVEQILDDLRRERAAHGTRNDDDGPDQP